MDILDHNTFFISFSETHIANLKMQNKKNITIFVRND